MPYSCVYFISAVYLSCFLNMKPTVSAEMAVPPDIIDKRLQEALIQMRDPSKGIPGLIIPDPMRIQDIKTVVNQGAVRVNASLWNSSISGLSTFKIAKVESNLVNLQLKIQLNVSELMARGNYSLEGTVTFMRVKGSGLYWMKMLNATLLGEANLTVTDSGQFEISKVQLDIQVRRIQLQFENLLGKGFVSSLSNSLLNALSKIIFENIKPFILQRMQTLARDAVNVQLAQLPPEPKLLSALSPLDLVMAQSGKEMKRLKFDPYALPNHQQSFQQKVLFFTTYGKAALYDGFVKGLSTLHRTGSIDVSFSNNTFQFSANFGFDQIDGGYKWLLNLMGVEKHGGVHFRVDSIDAEIVIQQENQKGSVPKIKLLRVNDIYQLRTDVDGLGSADLLLESFVNFATNIFKSQLTKIIEGPVTKMIQKNLNTMKLPF